MSNRIIVPDRSIRYAGHQLSEFKSQLQLDAAKRHILSFDDDPKSFYLSRDCRLGGIYSLSSTGAGQYLNAWGRGLGPLVNSLVSESNPDVNQQLCPETVAGIVNRVIKFRSPTMSGYKAIICKDRKQLDGFVTRSYKLISNELVYRQFEQASESVAGNFNLHLAELNGLEMTAVLIDPKSTLNCHGIKFCFGILLQNAETAGRAVRASSVMIDSITRTWALMPFDSSCRVIHRRGKAFRDKMIQMGDSLAQRHKIAKSTVSTVKDDPRKRSFEWSEDKKEKYRRQLLRLGDEQGLLASHLDPVLDSLQDYPRVSAWDTYAALLSGANQVSASQSLPLRQLAYRLLTQ